MSAREKILERLWWAVPSTDDADAKVKAAQMLDDFAHELAEQQRQFVREQARGPFHYGSSMWAIQGVDEAADSIDPEVKK